VAFRSEQFVVCLLLQKIAILQKWVGAGRQAPFGVQGCIYSIEYRSPESSRLLLFV